MISINDLLSSDIAKLILLFLGFYAGLAQSVYGLIPSGLPQGEDGAKEYRRRLVYAATAFSFGLAIFAVILGVAVLRPGIHDYGKLAIIFISSAFGPVSLYKWRVSRIHKQSPESGWDVFRVRVWLLALSFILFAFALGAMVVSQNKHL
jgi:hypothetical protein